MRKTFRIVLAVVTALTFAGCTDLGTFVAGGAKGFCTRNPGSGPCTRPAPVQTPGAPPR